MLLLMSLTFENLKLIIFTLKVDISNKFSKNTLTENVFVSLSIALLY